MTLVHAFLGWSVSYVASQDRLCELDTFLNSENVLSNPEIAQKVSP